MAATPQTITITIRGSAAVAPALIEWFPPLDMHLPEGHVCHCRHCDPNAFPAELQRETRAHDKHLGVRFGIEDRLHTPHLNGTKVDEVTELITGSDSWLVRYSSDNGGKPHVCTNCWQHVCEEVVYGDVTVERVGRHA